MTGSDAVYDAAFAQAGVIRVSDPDDLFEIASAFSRCAEPRGEGIAILSTSGGLGVVLADKCFKAIQALVGYHRFRLRHAERRGAVAGPASIDASAARAFVADKRGTLDEVDARRLLAFYGIAGPRERLARDEDEGARAAKDIGYPVAVKIVSPDLPHKTEAGAVTLGVRDEAALRRACEAMLARQRPGTRVRGLLVQEMIADGREMIVGASQDPQFGPVVTCGLGGVFVEVLRDVQRRIPPIDAGEARSMIAKLAGGATLGAFRGRPAANVDAAVDVIRRIGQLAIDLEDRIAEVEINPLMVTPRGAIAVDAVVVLRDPGVEP